MSDSHSMPRILIPHTINEVLGMAYREPRMRYWAGGTVLASELNRPSGENLPPVLIALSHVEELTRASRSDQSLEIGAMTTLEKLSTIGKPFLPAVLIKAIAGIETLPLRCQGTIGAYLARQSQIGDIRPLLHILNTKVDIRYHRKQRGKTVHIAGENQRIPLAGLNEYINAPQKNTLITRVSIPTRPWDVGHFVKIHPLGTENRCLVFCAIAKIDKSIITEFHMAVADTSIGLLRDKELEADITGRSLPLSEREFQLIESAADRITASCENHPFQRETVHALIRDFFTRSLV